MKIVSSNMKSNEYINIEKQKDHYPHSMHFTMVSENNDVKLEHIPQAIFFGKFTVYSMKSDLPVRWSTSKSEELFAFLLYKGKEKITKREICDALWPEGCSDLNNNLHMAIYKMKKTLKNQNINIEMKFVNGCYYISLPEIQCDVYDLKKIYSQMHEPAKQIDDKNYTILEKAVSIYSDDYLIDNDYCWVSMEREIVRDQFAILAKDLIFYHLNKREYTSAKRIILKLINNDNLDESVHELLLKLFILKSDRVGFYRHYQEMKALFLKELGIMPCNTIKELYDHFMLGDYQKNSSHGGK